MIHANVQTADWLRQTESILEELNEGVAIVDNQLRVLFANEALLRMGQYNREEIEGCRPEALFPANDIPYIIRQNESGLRYGRHRNEFYFPRKDGEKIPVIFSGRVIQGPDGQEYVMLIVTDISAQKHVEEQLRQSNSLLEQRQMEIETELSLAVRVQQSLAPQSLQWKDVSVETYYSPAHTIGGDFGIVFPSIDEALSVVMCDVSGHGIGSALMANRMYSEILHALDRKVGPSTVLKQLHDFVRNRIPVDSFYFTMAAARFSQSGRHVAFAAAGHPPAMLLSNGVVRLLDSQNGILGSLSEMAPSKSVNEIELAKGDRLILYTDGLVEVFNAFDDMLGVEGLQTLILESAQRPIQELKQAILNGVTSWRHGPLSDDVSLIIVEVT
jgi:sigma-B regulation protein RsbU (phosphoserine phosphatase)